jgi:hypothetical protein
MNADQGWQRGKRKPANIAGFCQPALLKGGVRAFALFFGLDLRSSAFICGQSL